MQLCSRNGEALRALTLYEWMQGGKRAGGPALSPSIYTYTEALRAALKAGEPHRAIQVMQLPQDHLPPSPFRRLFLSLRLQLCTLFPLCLSALMTRQVWEDAVSSGIRVDAHLLRAAMEAHVTAGRPGDAMELFDRFRESVKPGVQLYNGAMRAATLGAWVLALLLRVSRSSPLVPAPFLLHSYSRPFDEPTAADSRPEVALQLLEELRERGLKPSLQIHTSAISAAAVLCDSDLAYQLYKEALEGGTKADCRMLTALVTAFGTQHRWKQAVKVCLLAFLSVCLSVSVCLCVCLSLCLSFSVSISVCLSLSLCFSLHIPPPSLLHLSAFVCMFVPV